MVRLVYLRPPSAALEEARLRKALREVAATRSLGGRDVPVAGKLRLSFTRATKLHPALFVLGGWSDHDSGGFVVSEMAQNIRICIAEKGSKVSRGRAKYAEWWLALEDRIGYGALDERDRNQLRELVQVDDPWSKIILVNPLDPRNGFEL